jgi:methyl halide transferase
MTDWQSLYERGETPWNRGGPSPALLDWLAHHRMSGRVLVPGCGHGHDLTVLAGSGAEEILGLDIAPDAVVLARQRTAHLMGVRVEEGDYFTLPGTLPEGAFDWQFEHTCFCAIPRELRDNYVRSAAHVLKPGGHLLAVFYLRPWDESEDQDQGPPFGSSTEELDARFAPYFETLTSRVPASAYPGREGKELLRLLRRKS